MKTLLLLIFISGSMLANVGTQGQGSSGVDANSSTAGKADSDLNATLQSNANTDWVDKQIAAIKPPRIGTSHTAINRVNNPFIYDYSKLKKDGKGAKSAKSTSAKRSKGYKAPAKRGAGPLKLNAVMNKSALINGKWYTTDEKVKGYRISKIERDFVVLTSGKKEKKLYLSSANSKIKIQIK